MPSFLCDAPYSALTESLQRRRGSSRRRAWRRHLTFRWGLGCSCVPPDLDTPRSRSLFKSKGGGVAAVACGANLAFGNSAGSYRPQGLRLSCRPFNPEARHPCLFRMESVHVPYTKTLRPRDLTEGCCILFNVNLSGVDTFLPHPNDAIVVLHTTFCF